MVAAAPPGFVLVLARACQLVAHRYFGVVTKAAALLYPLPADKCAWAGDRGPGAVMAA